MAMNYPQFRVCPWGDLREISANKPKPAICYGIQIKAQKGAKWQNCCKDHIPIFYDTLEQASAAMNEIQKSQTF